MAGYSDREKKLALITGLVLGGALVWMTGLGPAIKRYKELSSELETARDQVARQQRSNRLDRPYKHELRDMRKSLVKAEAAAFWARIEKDIVDSGVKLTSSTRSNDERKPKAGFAVVRYQLNLQGNLKSLAKLLHKFQSSEGFFRARQISITPKRGGQLTANISISTLVPLVKDRQ